MVRQVAFEFAFGFFASGERRKLIGQRQTIRAADLSAGVARADFANVDVSDL